MCRCCDDREDEMILHDLRCSSRKEVHTEHNQIFVQQLREIDAPIHLLHLFEVGIEMALINRDTHSGEATGTEIQGIIDRNNKSELLNDLTIQMAFQQQTKLGWEQLLMGKMASGQNILEI